MMTARRRLFKTSLVLGVALLLSDYLLRAIGEAARHGSWGD
jgi:hypothetical protein